MNFDSYIREGRAKYAALAECIASILQAAVLADGKYRLQQVQHRAKDPSSLQKKLENAGALASPSIEDSAKDLAGCRLVFYTNADVRQFLGSGIIRDNFEVNWSRTKIHHPLPEASRAAELFNSNNFVVKFNEARVGLPEYTPYRDLWCEVQVQTSLNHAWAEMAHDTIYKKPQLSGFGKKLMAEIEERMKKIMRDHLLPAGYEFQKVLHDFERLSVGKDVFDQGALEAIENSADNNALHEVLESFLIHVLPNYDDLSVVQAEIRRTVVAAVKCARQRSDTSVHTPFGELPGIKIEKIADVAGDILDQMRYLGEDGVTETFDTLRTLYASAISADERKRWLSSAKALARQDRNIWKAAGPTVQVLIVERLRLPSVIEDYSVRPLILEVLGEVLDPVVQGTTSTYNQVMIYRGAVAVSDLLKQMRRDAIDTLKQMYRSATTDQERNAVIHTLATALSTPSTGSYSDSLVAMVLDDSRNIVDFYVEILPTQSYEVRQGLEDQTVWLFRRNRTMPEDIAENHEVAATRTALTKSIQAFRSVVDADKDYTIYKTLVGWNSIFPADWERDPDFTRQEEERRERVEKLVEQVTADNASQWLDVIKRCAQTESSDGATFISFSNFLKRLGLEKPNIAVGYLDQLDERLAGFLPDLLQGLDQGPEAAAAAGKVNEWIAEGKYLRPLAHHQFVTGNPNGDVLEKLVLSAVGNGVDDAIFFAIGAALSKHCAVEGGLISTVFMPALEYAAKKRDTRWTRLVRPHHREKSLFDDISPQQGDIVLASLIDKAQIGLHEDELLRQIGARWPRKLIDFFEKRFRLDEADGALSRYEAIPYNTHTLRVSLSKDPGYLLERARSWFEEDAALFQFRGGRLVGIAFPELSPDFSARLQELVNAGRANDLAFVVTILRLYKGNAVIHDLCKDVIAAASPDHDFLNEVTIALDSTGVVSGEFGFVSAYREKKALLEQWLIDPRERVQGFAQRHIQDLNQMIAVEQRNAEEGLEHRKREFGTEDTHDRPA